MRYKEMMNEEEIITSLFYSPTLSPLYLALPKPDLPHTHIPGGMRFHLTKKNEKEERRLR
jgi:hypothetical protein